MLIACIATGDVEDTTLDDGKDKAAHALSKKGGAARAVYDAGASGEDGEEGGREALVV